MKKQRKCNDSKLDEPINTFESIKIKCVACLNKTLLATCIKYHTFFIVWAAGAYGWFIIKSIEWIFINIFSLVYNHLNCCVLITLEWAMFSSPEWINKTLAVDWAYCVFLQVSQPPQSSRWGEGYLVGCKTTSLLEKH